MNGKRVGKQISAKELDALINLEVDDWWELRAKKGEIVPGDATMRENTFHVVRMECQDMTIPERVESRDLLIERGVEVDNPLTVHEKLHKRGAKYKPTKLPKNFATDDADEVIFIFPNSRVRDQILKQTAQQLQGQLDLVRSNVRFQELYTIEGKHLRFVLEDEDVELGDKNISYRNINSVV